MSAGSCNEHALNASAVAAATATVAATTTIHRYLEYSIHRGVLHISSVSMSSQQSRREYKK